MCELLINEKSKTRVVGWGLQVTRKVPSLCDVVDEEGATYFANVNETPHQVLVAQGVDRILRLIPCCVFNNSEIIVSHLSCVLPADANLPASL